MSVTSPEVAQVQLTHDDLEQLFADAEREARLTEDTINESSEDYTFIFGRSTIAV
ncbi:hypothetical protein [Cellulomonas sp. KH9]|uniref:hypothetical protein n=1 Tax=Cellulomonas sp. KH9 TaxID=1855324 RepID=UPI0008E102E7|nr:hypothetical protein [Cellulomonas sp. KH9]SFJ57763.1 hypothetical protein SAMN05216467_0035 [Cellulomonas sp. KH9]